MLLKQFTQIWKKWLHGLHLFIRTCIRGEKKSYKSQTGEMVPVLTGTDLLPSPQGHKVSLLMHAVKGNLANTVCKRKHQHIASVPVLGRPCMLFSNFYSFLWGWGCMGVEVMDFFFWKLHLTSVTVTRSQGEVATVWPHETKRRPRTRQWGFAAGQMSTHNFSCTVAYRACYAHSLCEKTGPQIFSGSDHLAS